MPVLAAPASSRFARGVFCALCLLGWSLPSHGQDISREEAESRLQALQVEISRLQESLAQSRERFAEEQKTLREADLEVQAGTLRLRELQARRAAHEKELQDLETDRQAYLESLRASKSLLSRQIVAAYQLGRESRLKLLLNQDSPARLSRMLAYYDYFSRAKASQIRELREALDTLDRMQAAIDRKLLDITRLEQQHREALRELQDRREERRSVVAGLAERIGSDESRLAELTRNRADLEALLERLASGLADIPTELGEYVSALAQRGSIPMPVSGRVLHAFGQRRMGGLNWQGWLIQAQPGQEVRSIAYGRVAFADWLRGYGLLMIIDHGDGIMSLYGHNESLLYDVGDWVQPGAPISTVGENPGTGQGLYFELRRDGKAVDPVSWISR